jgi:hypothetical protein
VQDVLAKMPEGTMKRSIVGSVLLLIASFTCPAHAEKRVALVVGNTSAAERSLVRRASVISTELEMLEAKFAASGQSSPKDFNLYQRGCGNLRRLLESVGLDFSTFLRSTTTSKRSLSLSTNTLKPRWATESIF